MEAFEKWFDKTVCCSDERCNPIDEDAGCIVCIECRKRGWRAALEQVMRWGMGYYGNDFLAMDLCKDIRKELRDDSEN